MKQRRSLKNRFLSLLLSLLTVVTLLPSSLTVRAYDNVIKIDSKEKFIYYMIQAASNSYANTTFELTCDIKFTEAELSSIATMKDFRTATFGVNSDVPFKGEFDGNGHTIKGLQYNASLAVQPCSGLFGYTDGAYIHDIIIDGADLDADRIGGIVAGYAKDTTFENITVKNSHLQVTCADNVLTLVTDGGLQGGAIVGYAKDCILYNCESDEVNINNNNTSGVQALGGKGLYLGGLVGRGYGTTIEYSRVYGGSVKNKYDVAVGALGGNTLYVGGIAGGVRNSDSNSSKIIDCFVSETELYFYCGTYVSVGAGNAGHAGGIVGAARDNTEITRSHYAAGDKEDANIHSKQYNAVLVIPVIQTNANISGIADIVGDDVIVTDSYFRSNAIATDTLGSSKTTSEYGPQTADRYVNRDFWEGHDYDFVGDTERSSKYSDSHINKWVMDYDLGIPVHGKSVAATLDFAGAGTATIAASNLVSSAVSTTDPYNFAVQGITFNESTVTLTADSNADYKFECWYKKEDVTADSVTDYSYFTNIFNSSEAVSSEASYTPTVSDNDLYVARYKANVTFYDLDGTTVVNDDYYHYNDALPEVTPTQTPASSTATLIGWTTNADKQYSAISSADLNTLKADGEFYVAGDPITKTLDLYPVYADLISNIHTIVEGYSKDALTGEDNGNSDSTTRYANYGTNSQQMIAGTSASMPDDKVILTLSIGKDVNFVSTDRNCTSTTNANATYRFIGWYDENGNLISRDAVYTLPSSVDLTQEHTYTAKFEYRVDYMARYTYTDEDEYHPFNETGGGKKYTDVWHTYGQTFENIAGPDFWGDQNTFICWVTDTYDGDENNSAVGKTIYAPLTVYTKLKGGTHNNATVTLNTDFPNTGTYEATGTSMTTNNAFTYTFPEETKDYYNFKFWSLQSFTNGKFGEHWTNANSTWTGKYISISYWYYGLAHITADVIFHDYDGTVTSVERRYQDNVLFSEDVYEQYMYPLIEDGVTSDTGYYFDGKKSPSNQARDGYYFIGWINVDELSEAEKAYVFKTNSDGSYNYYEANSIAAAQPYILTSSDIVEEAMPNVYAVYAKYDRSYTTNITSVPDTANKPADPAEISFTPNSDGTGVVTFTCDTSTVVLKDTTEPTYQLQKVTVYINGVEQSTELEATNGVYTYTITAGNTYVFKAYYEPLIVVYHLNDTDTNSIVKYSGDSLGDSPLPTYNLATIDGTTGCNYIFVGWTETAPTNAGYHSLSSYNDLSSMSLVSDTTIVMHSMDLYPVYAPAIVQVNSNIDPYLESAGYTLTDVRSLDRTIVDQATLVAKASDVKNYTFVGWFKDYTDLNNLGTEVTGNSEYVLENDEPFTTDTYTAVYRKVYKVNYHGTDGTTLYTAIVYEGDTRTFVTTQAVTDSDGNTTGETLTVPIDSEAFADITAALPRNVSFVSWQLVDTDEITTQWDTFYTQSVESLCTGKSVQELNLYPITQTITVKNANGENMDVTSEDPAVILGVQNGAVIVALNKEYTGNKLTVHVQQDAYTGTGTSTVTNIADKSVTLYPTATTEGTAYGTKTTDTNGNAVFEIGTLSFSKTVTGDFAETDREFNFTIQADDTIKSTVANQSYTVIVTNTDDSTSKTSTITFDNAGSASLTLKHGETATIKYLPVEVSYTVTEDSYSLSGYSTSIIVGDTTTSDRAYTMTLNSSTSCIAFTNNRDSFIPTGIDTDDTSFLSMVSIAELLILIFLITVLYRRHHRTKF